ncbi:MAG: MtrAB system histidine kinase MtrB [Microbacterium sp.]|uniref:MtrAB system histidine kinase MtrB n=1 Tax=Microbacterium sp. TaxID=51671 RepID=UPI0039E46902
MPAPSATTAAAADWRDWREWPQQLTGLWQRSLRFRTIIVTLALTMLAILVAGVWMSIVIQNDLFDSRKDQVLSSALRATQSAQQIFDSADVQGDLFTTQQLLNTVGEEIARQSASDMWALLRVDATPSAVSTDVSSPGFDQSILSDSLRESVRSMPGSQWWQSVALSWPDRPSSPGIAVGQQLSTPDVGTFEIYLAYDLDTTNETLQFVQRTLWIAGVALLVLIGVIAWFVVRSVAKPIAEAADTSARLAAGDLHVRLEVRGEDELATLGRSFNAMGDSIEAQIKRLAELSQVQQRFVSDVSHELRTPLTTIRLGADMVNDRRDDFDPSTARAAELLHTQVQRFETLLDDLLEISRYDAGSVQLELEPTSLAHLAEDVIESMAQLAEQRGSDVRLVAPGGYSPVDMDPRRVRRIVRNLLGNAIEHGEGRPIVVTVDSDQQAVALGVRDYGLGMAPDDVERVFDRFWRADPSRKRTIGGTGLGLSIALGDARLHGGTLAVWSELGRGTNFVLTLPRRDGRLGAGSPVPLEPDSAAALDALGHTQPIDVLGPGGEEAR